MMRRNMRNRMSSESVLNLTDDALQEFERLVKDEGKTEDECHMWEGPATIKGHGKWTWKGQLYWADAAWWTLKTRKELKSTQRLRHNCGTIRCINPKHMTPDDANVVIAEMDKLARAVPIPIPGKNGETEVELLKHRFDEMKADMKAMADELAVLRYKVTKLGAKDVE